MRVRMIHPNQWSDEAFAALDPSVRLLALALRNYADCNGIFETNAFRIKCSLMPTDDIDIEQALSTLVLKNIIMPIDEKNAIIRNFQRFQTTRYPAFKHREAALLAASMNLPDGYELNPAFPGAPGAPTPEPKTPAAKKPVAKEKRKQKPDDPLADFPLLQEKADGIIAAFKKTHGTSPNAQQAKDVLAKLVRLDGFSEQDVIDCLRWMLTKEEPNSSGFSWRSVIKSPSVLRATTKNGATKFKNVYDKWKGEGQMGSNAHAEDDFDQTYTGILPPR